MPEMSCEDMYDKDKAYKYVVRKDSLDETGVCVDNEAYYLLGAGDPESVRRDIRCRLGL